MTQISSETVAQTSKAAKPDAGIRRARLREFQTQLMARMQAAQSGSQTTVSQLGIMIGRSRYLVALREAGEIVTAGNMTKVPLTKDWYLGLANVRGNLTSVVDLSRFEGNESTLHESSCRVVAFASGLAFNSGLLVSQVLGLRDSNKMEKQVLTSENVDGLVHKPWIVNQYLDVDGNLWSELSLSLLVQDQEFLHVGL
ncbi:MAG: chemotaxis protein CheW [Cytophaga sp.]|nr:chemotaxis protein CheW [Undibacterium sp.]